ncbi:unnamed protein product [Ilex paraguariensis]|uniref:Transcription repressor n=1 Tax=Ilex paraguariensis TaxID=185542 RepID=A0ABC8RYN0_9AQUA
MMKWGRKKSSSSSPSSSHPPSISRVFPSSWLLKFKHMGGGSPVMKGAKTMQKGKMASECSSSVQGVVLKEGRFYGPDDDDSYWRLSFGEERFDGVKSRGVGLQSVWYNSDDEVDDPMLSSKSLKCRDRDVAGGEEGHKFSDMVSAIRKVRELPLNVENFQGNDTCKGRKESAEAKLKKTRRKAAKDQKTRRMNRSILEEKGAELARGSDKEAQKNNKSVEKDIFEIEPARLIRTKEEDYKRSTVSDSRRQHSVSFVNSNLRTTEEDCLVEALNLEETKPLSEEEMNPEMQKWKDNKIRELMLKSEKQRKSIHIRMESQKRRTKQSCKFKVHSPRIAALEDIKKAKMKMNKKTNNKVVKDRTAFDSFAVVKSSLDPQQDFKDSMVEMIMEKGIRQPEELKELLACYLTLNCNEYHELIIKVFRQFGFNAYGIEK